MREGSPQKQRGGNKIISLINKRKERQRDEKMTEPLLLIIMQEKAIGIGKTQV